MVTVDSVPGTGSALALQPDDSVVVAGSDTAETRFVIARYTTDGRLDTTFGGGAVSTDFAAPGTIGLDAGATTVIVAPDGKTSPSDRCATSAPQTPTPNWSTSASPATCRTADPTPP